MAKKFQIDTGGTLTTNLISYYKLEGLLDFFGIHHTTESGSPVIVSAKISNGYRFNAIAGQYLTTPNHANFNFGSAFSISLWYKPVATIIGNAGLIGKWEHQPDTVGTNQWTLIVNTAAGQILLATVTGSQVNLASTFNLNNTAHFYHIIVIYNGANMRMFIDGILNNSVAQTGNITSAGTLQRVEIGNYASAFAGQISCNAILDEIAVWNKALSATEIADLYNGGAGQTMIEDVIGASFLLNFV